jgi:hypothetical protein
MPTGQAGATQAGFSRQEITPEKPTRMGGYRMRREKSIGVHDQIFASCAVISKGSNRVVLLALDLLCLMHDTVARAKAAINKSTTIPPSNIVIGCTHTHSGPDTKLLFYDDPQIKEYCDTLPEILSNLVQEALAKLSEVKVSIAQVNIYNVAYNRRLLLKDGTETINVIKVDPREIVSSGPIDPDATIVFFEHNGTYTGALVNFTLHATILGETNLLYTRDFAGYLVDDISSNLVGQPITLFFNGAFGNINQIEKPGIWNSTFKEAQRIAESISRPLLNATPYYIYPQNIKILHQFLNIPRREHSITTHETHQKIAYLKEKEMTSTGEEKQAALKDRIFLQEALQLSQLEEQVELQLLKIGPLEIIVFPGEVFVEHGLAVKNSSQSDYCLIFGNCNGYIGYVPLAASFEKGGYETRFSFTSRLIPEAGDQIVNTIKEMRRHT